VSKKRTVQILLAIMAGMAALTLVFALWTKQSRRDNDFKNKALAPNPPVEKPSQLFGLAYLPRGSNLALGLHIAALGEEGASNALLSEPRPQVMASVLDPLDTLGIPLADVDHIVAGGELKDLFFSLTTVIVTRKDYDRAEIDQSARRQNAKASTYRNQPFYHFPDRAGVPKLWCAGPRVLVWSGLKKDELDRIVPPTMKPSQTLTPAAYAAVADHLSTQSRLWIAGDLEPAKNLVELAVLATKDQAPLLRTTRRFALGVTIDAKDQVTIRGDFQTGDAAASAELRKYLDTLSVKGAKSQKTDAPPPSEDAENQWVTWQVRGDAEAIRDALGKLRVLPSGKKLGLP
jgi:hypothetical protein